jgi:hypothetical protein
VFCSQAALTSPENLPALPAPTAEASESAGKAKAADGASKKRAASTPAPKAAASKKPKKKDTDKEGEDDEDDGELEIALAQVTRDKMKKELRKVLPKFPRKFSPKVGESNPFTKEELLEAKKEKDALFPEAAVELAKKIVQINGTDAYCNMITQDYFASTKRWYIGLVVSVGTDPFDPVEGKPKTFHEAYSILFQDSEIQNYHNDETFLGMLTEDSV